jgi:GTP-binding protein EngB required for normal cell division
MDESIEFPTFKGKSSKSDRPPNYRKDEETNIKVFDLEQHNVLLLGESRTGKSTFKEVLHNINHVTKMEVWRGTVIPTSSTSLFQVNGKYISINMLDTPGFGEVAKVASRKDDSIRNLIMEFVKKDITKLSLILITINGSGGITAAQIQNITSCLKFLGRQVASKTCFLVTHFENRTHEEETRWIEEFKANPNMSFLVRACQGGFLFTGALNDVQFASVAIRDNFIEQQRRRNGDLFQKLMDGEPVSLMSPEMKQAKSTLAVQESVSTSCINLQTMIPEVIVTYEHALNIRVKISKAIENGLIKDEELLSVAEDVVEKMACIGSQTDDINEMKLDENVLSLMTDYEKIGEEIQERYAKVLDLLSKYSELDQMGSTTWTEIEWCI